MRSTVRIYLQVDEESDQVYLGFGELGKPTVAKTVRVSEEIYVDLDKEYRLVGVDIDRASKVLDGNLREVQIDTLVGVAEASHLLGVSKGNFIRDYANKPAFPKPVVELASGRIWLRSQIETYVATLGRVRPSRRPSRRRAAVS